MVLFFLTLDAVFNKKLLSMRGCACRPRVAGVAIARHWSSYPVAVSCLWSFAPESGLSVFILSSYWSSLGIFGSVLISGVFLFHRWPLQFICTEHFQFSSFAFVGEPRLLKWPERGSQPTSRAWMCFHFSWALCLWLREKCSPLLSSDLTSAISSPEESLAQLCGLWPGLHSLSDAVPWLFLHFNLLLSESTRSSLARWIRAASVKVAGCG